MRSRTNREVRSLMKTFSTTLSLLLACAVASPAVAGGAGGGSTQISLSFPQLAVIGGEWEIAKVILSQPAPSGGASVKVASSTKDVTIAPLTPASLSVPAGSTSVSFKVITKPVSKMEIAAIGATYGSATTLVKLTLQPNGVASVSLSPVSVDWGGSAKGGVQLKSPAPQDVHYYKNMAAKGAPPLYMDQVRYGGVTVTLQGGSVKVPSTVKIASGTSYAPFTATAPQKSACSMGNGSPLTAAITATWLDSKSENLTVGKSNGQPSRYTSKTIRINPSTILGISHDAHALVLNGADKCVQSLVTGDVMYLKSLGVLDVKKVLKTPQHQVAVAVSSASLTDFINDGTFQVFSQKLTDASAPSGPWKQGEEPDEPQGGDSGWKFNVSGSGTDYSFTAFKENNGLSASVSGHGQMANAGYNFLAVIHGDKLQQATFTVPLDGTLDVDWMAQTTASGQGIGESRLRLPALHSGLVDSADGIPLLFQVFANLIFKPGFGEKAAAKGHFKITFKGEGGIDGSTPINQSLDVTPDISSTTSSAKAAHGAVVAINAPKFALSLSTVSFLWAVDARDPGALNAKGADLADSLQSQLGQYVKADLMPPTTDKLFDVRRAAYVMWVSSVAYAGSGLLGTGLLSPVPCQQYYQTYLANAGMDKDMLGSISGSIPPDKGVDVFKKTGVSAIPSIQGCMPKK
jgi:hypothetical protein